MIQVIPLMIGATELLLIAGIALLLFGGKKLPEMMRGLGRGVKEFKEGMNEGTKPENNEANSEKETVADDQNSIGKENNDK